MTYSVLCCFLKKNVTFWAQSESNGQKESEGGFLEDAYFLGLIFVCLILSGFFSGSETALLRLNMKKIDRLLKDKPSITLEAVRELNQSTSRLLVTILLGNNVVNIFGAAAASSLAVAHYGEEKGLIVATTSMTLLVLIFSEILPKTIAANNSLMVSSLVALPLYAFHKVLTPIHWLFEKGIDPLIRTFQAKDEESEGPASYEELMMMAREVKHTSKKKGVTPLKVIGATAKSTEIVLEEVMVNRAKIKACSIDLSLKDAMATIVEDRYTRFPVYRNGIDDVVGVIHLRDLVKNVGTDETLESLCRPVIFFTEKTKLFQAMTILQSSRQHLALVRDEFGVIQGLVTLEDIIEEIVGEIRDEFDEIELEQVIKTSSGSFIVDATLFVSDINKRTGLKIISERRDTLSGFLSGRIEGELKDGVKFSDGVCTFVVLKAGKGKIEKVEITAIT